MAAPTIYRSVSHGLALALALTIAPLRSANAQAAATATVPLASVTADPALAARAAQVRAACRDARRVDLTLWIGGAGLIAAGGVLTGYGLLTPLANRGPGVAFALSLGPGLVLGGIGTPIARGAFEPHGPLEAACDEVLRDRAGRPEDAADIEVAARLLNARGRPIEALPIVLLGIGSGLLVGGIIVAAAINNNDLEQIFGGLAAAAITGWVLVVPTPTQFAARRFARGEYAPTVQLAPLAGNGVAGLAAVGAF